MPNLQKMVTPAMGIKDIIEEVKPSLYTGYVLRTGVLIGEPDRTIAFLDTGGKGAEAGLTIDYPTVQILVRGDKEATGYVDSYNVIMLLRDALVGIPSKPAEYPALTSCTQRGNPTFTGYDTNRRPIWSLNLQLIVEPSFVRATVGWREQ